MSFLNVRYKNSLQRLLKEPVKNVKPIGNGLVKSVTDQCPISNGLLRSVIDRCRIGNGL
jgi:hypothetical protein